MIKFNSDADKHETIFDNSAKPHIFNRTISNDINFGTGIKVLRLYEGRVIEIEEEGSDEKESSQEKDDSLANNINNLNIPGLKKQEDNEEEDASGNDFNVTMKSKKTLNAVINDKSPPSTIKNLNYTAHFVLLVLIGLSLGDYLASKSQLKTIQQDINLMDLSYQFTTEFMNILSNTRDLYLTNISVFDDDPVTLEASLKSSILTSLDEIGVIKQKLDQQISSVSSAHAKLYNNPIISLNDINGGYDYKGLDQATDLVVSKAIEISVKPLDEIRPDDPDYYFITFNLLNDYYTALTNSSDMYATQLEYKAQDRKGALLVLLVVSGCSLLVIMAVLFYVLFSVIKAREEVLTLFLDISEKTIKGLYSKCENFVSNIQIGEEDELASNLDEDDFVEERKGETDMHEFVTRKKKRKFKNSGKGQQKLFLYFIVVALIIEAIFLYNFLSTDKILQNVSALTPEIKATIAATSFYSFVNNVLRQLLIDQTFPILNNSSPIQVVIDNTRDMYNLDTLINQVNLLYLNSHKF